jgi:hypothetical protein
MVSLLTELKNLFGIWFYKLFRPYGLKSIAAVMTELGKPKPTSSRSAVCRQIPARQPWCVSFCAVCRLGSDKIDAGPLSIMRQRSGRMLRQRTAAGPSFDSIRPRSELRKGQRHRSFLGRGSRQRALGNSGRGPGRSRSNRGVVTGGIAGVVVEGNSFLDYVAADFAIMSRAQARTN